MRILLALQVDQPAMVPLLRSCPNLRSFSWDGFRKYPTLDNLHTMLKAGHLRQLENLETHRRMDVRQLALCVEAMGQVKRLDMAQDIAEEQLWQAVRRRFSTLE